MAATSDTPLTLDDVRPLLDAGDALLSPALERAQELTKGGRAIDDHQVMTERVAYAATELRAVSENVLPPARRCCR